MTKPQSNSDSPSPIDARASVIPMSDHSAVVAAVLWLQLELLWMSHCSSLHSQTPFPYSLFLLSGRTPLKTSLWHLMSFEFKFPHKKGLHSQFCSHPAISMLHQEEHKEVNTCIKEWGKKHTHNTRTSATSNKRQGKKDEEHRNMPPWIIQENSRKNNHRVF
jgi:hypothetical protein